MDRRPRPLKRGLVGQAPRGQHGPRDRRRVRRHVRGRARDGHRRRGSLQTDDAKRDDYVRSAEFLDAEAFPELRFSAEASGADGDAITGELTIRDTTLPLTLHVQRLEADAAELRLELTGAALRRPYGLKFPHAFGAADRSVADEVELVLDLVLVPA